MSKRPVHKEQKKRNTDTVDRKTNLVTNPRRQGRKDRRVEIKYSGPYNVTQVAEHSCTYELEEDGMQ